MLNTLEDLEAQLLRLDRRFERLDDDTVLVRLAPNQPPAALRISAPVLVLQVEIATLPEGEADNPALFRRLLELNAQDLLHAAYGLSNGEIVLTSALEMANLDSNELEAVLADFDLALANHIGQLHALLSSSKA